MASVGLDALYQHLLPRFPKLTDHVEKVLLMVGLTYFREDAFSIMSISKTKLCSKLTQKHLNNISKNFAARELTPDFCVLSKVKKNPTFTITMKNTKCLQNAYIF